ncbi:MAG: arginine--tRNA ligase [Candidatus Kapabacteria bacterium]|nr:arginine--tRNA ligase [Candidatus Kapabacteria bacterium]
MQRYIEPQLRAALLSLGVTPPESIAFSVPRQDGHGHLSANIAMVYAKGLNKQPKAFAQEIVDALGQVALIANIEIAGPGFINFTFSDDVYHAMLRDLEAMGDHIGKSTVGAGKSVNVEYVSANPTGPLHAGHGRNCAVGDTIANLFSWCGYDVTREYYFNNAGNQMNKLGQSIYARVQNQIGNVDYPFPEDGYHGEYIHTVAQDISRDHRAEFESLNEVDAHTFCRKQGETWCFASIQKTLESMNIHHDEYFNEDSLYSDGKVAATIDALRELGLVYEKDGAQWFALTELGAQQDKVIVKSTGEPTYRLPDIAYHRDKLQRGFDVIVDIFGADHIATIPDVLAGVRALGFNTDQVKVVIHQMVTFVENGEIVKFSKRSGTSFTLDELIEEVGADVVRFFFVMRAVGTHLEFDLGLAKEEGEKNPVFYLQYAHARICSILRKASEKGLTPQSSSDISILTHPREIELIGLLSRMQVAIERACENLEPHTIAEYLRDVAAAYHNFYHDCRILNAEPNIEAARLLLAEVTRRAMRNGLLLLGVGTPERM